jgi:hypothetical protein
MLPSGMYKYVVHYTTGVLVMTARGKILLQFSVSYLVYCSFAYTILRLLRHIQCTPVRWISRLEGLEAIANMVFRLVQFGLYGSTDQHLAPRSTQGGALQVPQMDYDIFYSMARTRELYSTVDFNSTAVGPYLLSICIRKF